ncbi:MAG: ATP-grasp domain-containing protein [Phycisphaerales bacterium]|nr:ATP-grasp domain-containing protein [Phycisphaerales bacterium]
MKIVILHDEIDENSRLDEIDALQQAALVGAALRNLGHDVETEGVSPDLGALSAMLDASHPDVVFNLVESLGGHGRLVHVIPSMLEAWGIPFTGGGSSVCLLTTCKPLAKSWLHQDGICTPAWRYPRSASSVELTPPCVCIVKPAWEDASVGIEDDAVIHVAGMSELDAALDAASTKFGDVFAELFLDGREFNVSLLADGDDVEVLPVAEIEFVDFPSDKPRIVGYSAKWSEGSFEYGATQRRFGFSGADESLIGQLRELAAKCWRLFDLRGYARVDFRADAEGHPWVIEVNTNPCLAADAGFLAAARQRGLTTEAVIERILAASSVRKEVQSHA